MRTLLAGVRRSLSQHWYAWVMVLPVVVVLAVIIGYPLGRGIFLSFTNANEANLGRTVGDFHVPSTYEFVGLDNSWQVLSGQEGSF